MKSERKPQGAVAQRRLVAVSVIAAAALAVLAFAYLGAGSRGSSAPGELAGQPAQPGQPGMRPVDPGPDMHRAEAPARPVNSGAAQLRIDAADGGLANAPKPGEHLDVSFGSTSHKLGLVIGIDEKRRVSVLWPPGGTGSAALDGQGRLSLRAPATPLRIIAAFSDAPLTAQDAATGLPKPGVDARELTVVAQP